MKKGLVIAGSVVAAAALVYLESSFCFIGRFPFNTYIDGENVSLLTASQANRSVQTALSKYVLTITGRNDVTDTITADEVGLSVDASSEVNSMVHRKSILTWPLSLLSRTNYTTTTETEFNKEKLSSAVSSLAFYDAANVIEPTDATYDLVNGAYELIPEDEGALLDDDRTLSEIAMAIGSGADTLDLDAAGCYQSPEILSTDESLSADLTTLNHFVSMEIHLDIGPDGEDIDAATIASWIVAEAGQQAGMEAGGDDTDSAAAAAADAMEDAESSGETASGLPDGFTFDTEKITKYVEDLAEKYDTYGETHTIKTQHGTNYTSALGSYGWWLNQESTKAAILSALNSGEGGDIEPVFYQKAAQWPTEKNGNDDIGSTYAEVDLDNQHVYMIKEGKVVWESDCVSGKATYDRLTPDGFYRLTFKQLDATLKGEGYESPVRYWMPFNLGIGFHDANWRSSFGGKIYLTNGSHGCINLPPSKAGQLYEYVYAGMPVIVYGGMTPEQASSYVANGGSTAGTSTSSGSSSSSSSASSSSGTASSSTATSEAAGEAASTTDNAAAEQQAAQEAAAAQQVTEAAGQIANQIYEQQINSGASAEDAMAAAQAAANAAVSAAGQ